MKSRISAIEGYQDTENYGGHLVAVAGDYLIDASVRQFNAPEYGLSAPNMYVTKVDENFLTAQESVTLSNSDDGCVLVYSARPGVTDYTINPAFRSDPANQLATSEIVNGLQSRLG